MISVRFDGRLGNNMWQIACCLGTALKCGTTCVFPEWKYAGFFSNELPKGELLASRKLYVEPAFHYNEIRCQGDLELRGYWQSSKYWCAYTRKVLEQFTPSDGILRYVERIQTPGAVGIHVRRTDYVTRQEYHPVLPMVYYEMALEQLKGPVMVFSDDIQWCRKNIKADYYSDGNEGQDLFLLASCTKKVIANSSFSHWATYLGEGEVVAPAKDRWFGPKLKHKVDDMYEDNWILI